MIDIGPDDAEAVIRKLERKARKNPKLSITPEEFQKKVKKRKYDREYYKKKKTEYDIIFNQDETYLNLVESISTTWYQCCECNNYITQFKNEMITHFKKKHNADYSNIKLDPYPYENEMDYLILKKLVETYESQTKNKFICISNQILCETLGAGVNNQKPRRILEDLGLLTKEKYQRKWNISYDTDGKRIYYVSINRLKDVVFSTIYDDLKIRLGLLNKKEYDVRPVSLSVKKVEEEGNKTGGAEELDDDDIDFSV